MGSFPHSRDFLTGKTGVGQRHPCHKGQTPPEASQDCLEGMEHYHSSPSPRITVFNSTEEVVASMAQSRWKPSEKQELFLRQIEMC